MSKVSKVEAPMPISDQINDFIWREKRRCREDKLEFTPVCYYQQSCGSLSSVAHRFTWFNNNYPHALVVQVWNDKEDWTILRYSILANDPEVEEAVKPIIEQYIKDLKVYYDDPADQA